MEDWNRCVPYGLDADGRARGIDEVPNGLRCGPRCPACGGELIARQGEVKVHHLAHHNQGSCSFEREFRMRDLIARVLRDLPSITLPPAIAQPLPNRDAVTYPAQTIRLDDCDLEDRGTTKQPPIVGRFRHATLRFVLSDDEWLPADVKSSMTTSVLMLHPWPLATAVSIASIDAFHHHVASAVSGGRWIRHARSLRMAQDVGRWTTERTGTRRFRLVEVRDCPLPNSGRHARTVRADHDCGPCPHLAGSGTSGDAPWVACCGDRVEEVRGDAWSWGFRWGDGREPEVDAASSRRIKAPVEGSCPSIPADSAGFAIAPPG